MAAYSPNNPSNRLRARRLLDRIVERAQQAIAEGPGAGGDPSVSAAERLVKKVGAGNLEELIEEAELGEGLGTDDLQVEMSGHGEAVFRYLTRENLEGLHIYPGEHGGWYADITMKDLPPGVPRVIGTPVAMPCATREEAVEQGMAMIEMVLNQIEAGKADRGRDRSGDTIPFSYHGVELQIPLKLLEGLKELQHPGEDYSMQRLEEIGTELFGGAYPTSEITRTFSTDQLARFMSVAGMALLAGVHRWPIPAAKPPKSKVN